MKPAPALLLLIGTLAGCMSPARYDAKFEDKFCAEWVECNPDWECDLGETDHTDCSFDRQAAKACLTGEWICDNSNTLVPQLLIPSECDAVYTGCTTDTGPTGLPPAGGTTSGTPTGSR